MSPAMLCPVYLPIQCSLSKQITVSQLAIDSVWMASLLAKETLSTSISFRSYYHKGVTHGVGSSHEQSGW